MTAGYASVILILRTNVTDGQANRQTLRYAYMRCICVAQ